MLFHWALLPLLWIRGVLPGGSARWRFDFRWTSDEVGAFLRACRTVQHCSTSQSFSIFAFNLGTEAATRGRCTPFPWTIYHWTLLRNEAARVYFEQQKAGRKVQASRLVLRLREDGADNESEPVTPILDDHMDHDNIVPLIINNLSCHWFCIFVSLTIASHIHMPKVVLLSGGTTHKPRPQSFSG